MSVAQSYVVFAADRLRKAVAGPGTARVLTVPVPTGVHVLESNKSPTRMSLTLTT